MGACHTLQYSDLYSLREEPHCGLSCIAPADYPCQEKVISGSSTDLKFYVSPTEVKTLLQKGHIYPYRKKDNMTATNIGIKKSQKYHLMFTFHSLKSQPI